MLLPLELLHKHTAHRPPHRPSLLVHRPSLLVLRIYLILLLVTLFAFIFIFMSCFYFAANVDELTAKYWNDPLFQEEKNRCDPT